MTDSPSWRTAIWGLLGGAVGAVTARLAERVVFGDPMGRLVDVERRVDALELDGQRMENSHQRLRALLEDKR